MAFLLSTSFHIVLNSALLAARSFSSMKTSTFSSVEPLWILDYQKYKGPVLFRMTLPLSRSAGETTSAGRGHRP